MEYKIIQTENYLLIVDESEIKGKGFRLDLKRNSVGFIDDDIYYNERKDEFKKIISHLPLNNSPILEGVDLLPPLKDEVEKISKQESEKLHDKGKHDDWDIYNQLVYEDAEMIKIGYNKAKEKYKYTEDDLKTLISKIRSTLPKHNYNHYSIDYNEIIQSLQQPKMPVGFKCEVEDTFISNGEKYLDESGIGQYYTHHKKPKTTTNSQGLTQWVGEYIFYFV